MNEKVQTYLNSNKYSINLKSIKFRKKLKDLEPSDWPKDPCISCLSWVPVSQEMHLGECRLNAPKPSDKKGDSIAVFPTTPPHYFCQKHCDRDSKTLSYKPDRSL